MHIEDHIATESQLLSLNENRLKYLLLFLLQRCNNKYTYMLIALDAQTVSLP